MIRVIVLDVDDTVYLERDYVASGFAAVGAWAEDALGVVGVGERAWALFESGRRATTLTDALAELGVEVSADLRRSVIALYREHDPVIRMLEDARDLVRAAQSEQVALAVLTDGPVTSQSRKVRALGLQEVAAPLVLTAELGKGKPDPAGFRLIERHYDLPGSSFVYLGDNPVKDFQGPQELGWQTLRVRRPGSLHHTVSTPAGVPEVVDLVAAAEAVLRDGGAALAAFLEDAVASSDDDAEKPSDEPSA